MNKNVLNCYWQELPHNQVELSWLWFWLCWALGIIENVHVVNGSQKIVFILFMVYFLVLFSQFLLKHDNFIWSTALSWLSKNIYYSDGNDFWKALAQCTPGPGLASRAVNTTTWCDAIKIMIKTRSQAPLLPPAPTHFVIIECWVLPNSELHCIIIFVNTARRLSPLSW